MRKLVVTSCALAAGFWLQVPLHAHHTADRLSVPVLGCGWAEADGLRDRANLSEFCQRWVPTSLGIRMAAADHELIEIEASPELVAAVREDRRATGALLHDWLKHWRSISGYKTATIMLMRNHRAIAKIYTTMSGEVVVIR